MTTNESSPTSPESLLNAIFKAYDIRGVVPEQFSEELAEAIGFGFAKLVLQEGRSNRVLVARDMRESGVSLQAALIRGVTGLGLDVVELGLASTDMAYFASGSFDAPAAMFTASHNPAKYNGIKMCLSGARPIGEESGLRAIKNYAADYLSAGKVSEGVNAKGSAGNVESADVLEQFASHVRSFVEVETLNGLKVVADTANGMGGLVVPKVFEKIDCELTIIFPELDGNFPNHPADPIQPENLEMLIKTVVERGADVGLAFDGDADRVFLVDELGVPLDGSLTTAMVAKSILEKHPGSTVLYNLICSKTVREVIEENGGNGIRTRVGHSFIKKLMAETGAVFGGEHSGHYYFKENYRADSGLIAALVVLEMIAVSGKPLSELRKPFERYVASGEINTEVPNPNAAIDKVENWALAQEGLVSHDRLDGLTADFGQWWFNLRPSNTEPLLRLNAEAADRSQCDEKVALISSLFSE